MRKDTQILLAGLLEMAAVVTGILLKALKGEDLTEAEQDFVESYQKVRWEKLKDG